MAQQSMSGRSLAGAKFCCWGSLLLPPLKKTSRSPSGFMKFSRNLLCVYGVLSLIGAIANASPVKSAEQRPLVSGAAAANPQPMIMLVSLDGFRREYLSNADALGLSIPNIRQLMRQGRRDRLHLHMRMLMNGFYSIGSTANGAVSVYPALTYPAHTSMITGVYPDRHGIWQNEKYDPQHAGQGLYVFAPDVQVPTVFDAASANGITVSSVNWPLTAFSPALTYALPDLPTRTPVEAAFSFYGCIQSALFREQIPTVDALTSVNDTVRLNLALSVLRLPGKTDPTYPRLQALHLIDFDHAEHVHGVFSPEALATLEYEDQLIGQLMKEIDNQQLANQMHVLLVADHGFADIPLFVAPNGIFL